MIVDRWHHRVAQIERTRAAWNEAAAGNMAINPVVGLIEDGERVYAYGYDANFLSGLMAEPCDYYLIDHGGEQALVPEFSLLAEMSEFIVNHLGTVNRSGFVAVFQEPTGEGGAGNDREPDFRASARARGRRHAGLAAPEARPDEA
jgi:hypothetical protein